MTTDHPAVSKQHLVRYNTIRVTSWTSSIAKRDHNTPRLFCFCMDFQRRPTCFEIWFRVSPPQFHIVAPDYPGFGQSSMPSHNDFDYSFENLTNVVEALIEKLVLTKYSIYVMDYGAPIGYRLALRHPARVQALIVQNGNAYDEGLRKFWDPIKKYWSDPTTENREAIRFLVDPKSTR
jgi:pimeloyl-ACP methyl ester carboxylesterase